MRTKEDAFCLTKIFHLLALYGVGADIVGRPV